MSANRPTLQKLLWAIAVGVGMGVVASIGGRMLLGRHTVIMPAAVLAGTLFSLLTLWCVFFLGRVESQDSGSKVGKSEMTGLAAPISNAPAPRRAATDPGRANPFRSPIAFDDNTRSRKLWAGALWATVVALGGWFCLFLTIYAVSAARNSLIQWQLRQTHLAARLGAEATRLLLAALMVLCLVIFAYRKMGRKNGAAKRGE